MSDIQDIQDVEMLVDTFYQKVFNHDALSPFFKHLDYPIHRVKMIQFWSFVLLDQPGYTTQVYDKHAHMRFDPILFDTWAQLFCETVQSLFQGEKADMAQSRAKMLAWTFAEKFKNRDHAQ